VEHLNDLTFLKRGIRESDLGSSLSASILTAQTSKSESVVMGQSAEQSTTGEVEEEVMMKPLFFELSSSLNVELVYIILKSITQFAYVRASAHSEVSV